MIDENKSVKMGNLLFLVVKGHVTEAIANTKIFNITGIRFSPNTYTFPIGVGSGAWSISAVKYGYANADSVVARLDANDYFHVCNVFFIQ